MPCYKDNDVIRLTVDLIDIDYGYGETVSLPTGEKGTIMAMKGD